MAKGFRLPAIGRPLLKVSRLRQRAKTTKVSYDWRMFKMLKLVDPDFYNLKVSSTVTFRIISEAVRVARYNKKPRIAASGEIESVVRLLTAGQLTKYAVWEGTKLAKKSTSMRKAVNNQTRPEGVIRRFSLAKCFLHRAVRRLSLTTSLLLQDAGKSEKWERRVRKSKQAARQMYKMLKLVDPELNVSSTATFQNITSEAARVAGYNKKPAISASGEIETALRLLTVSELTKYALWEGTHEGSI